MPWGSSPVAVNGAVVHLYSKLYLSADFSVKRTDMFASASPRKCSGSVSFQELVSIRDGNSLPSFRILPLQPAFPLEARPDMRAGRAAEYSSEPSHRVEIQHSWCQAHRLGECSGSSAYSLEKRRAALAGSIAGRCRSLSPKQHDRLA